MWRWFLEACVLVPRPPAPEKPKPAATPAAWHDVNFMRRPSIGSSQKEGRFLEMSIIHLLVFFPRCKNASPRFFPRLQLLRPASSRMRRSPPIRRSANGRAFEARASVPRGVQDRKLALELAAKQAAFPQ